MGAGGRRATADGSAALGAVVSAEMAFLMPLARQVACQSHDQEIRICDVEPRIQRCELNRSAGSAAVVVINQSTRVG
jgi:hypothetical protein